MKTIYKSALWLFATIAMISTTQAQSLGQCGLLQEMKKLSHADSLAFLQNKQVLDTYTKNYIHHHQNKSANDSIYIIPLVFHIIHDYGQEDISKAQVLDEVNILNRDYRKRNADTSLIINGFDSIAADAHIEFRLAKKDPNGNCTDGIDRIASKLTYNADDFSKLNQWPPNDYLNVWVINVLDPGNNTNGTTLAYAILPPTAAVEPWDDGVIMRADNVGTIGYQSGLSDPRTLTHEIGHILNLEHPWGGTNSPGVACGDDGVADTPPTDGNFGNCPLNYDACSPSLTPAAPDGIIENVNNIMNYSNCKLMFTNDQVARMRAALTSPVANRSHLISAQNAAFTGIDNPMASPCAPKADFMSNYKYICDGGTVKFTDRSWNGTVTTRSWLFDGGTPATSTDSVVNVTFSSPGWHAVTLTVSNAEGSDTKTENKYVYVNSTTAAFQGTFSEPFEDQNRFDTQWVKHNPYDNSTDWTRTTMASAGGSACAYVHAYNSNPGIYNVLISPSIDVSTITPPYFLHFKYACATKAPTLSQIKGELHVYCSKNCGLSWIQLSSLTGSNLTNAGSYSTEYTPKYSDWTEITTALPVAPTGFIMLKFVYQSGPYSNNIFLDDINVDRSNSIQEIKKNVLTAVNIYPNPTNNKADVTFHLSEKSNVTMALMDFSGRIVRNYNYDNLSQGDVKLPIDCSNLAAGIYMVKLSTDKNVTFKKLMVK